jgi:Holliday junction resolvase RusA-like endonuclease
MIQFSVPIVAVAQPRQRHRVIKQKDGKAFSGNYTPTKHPVNSFKASVRQAANAAYSGPPLTGPIRMDLVFVLPRTKPAWLKKTSRWWKEWKAGRRVPHAVSRNDRDNLMKSFQDALNQLTWVDDGQVYAGPVEKWIAADDEQPHVEVLIVSEF